jgi:hypothetical protein
MPVQWRRVCFCIIAEVVAIVIIPFRFEIIDVFR